MEEQAGAQTPPVIIKKYANRRLYNTATSSYVTLDDLARMVKEGREFVVNDAKTGEDITRAVLTQIIVEEEQKGQNLLPISFLRQLIGLYGNNMQWLVPRYLEHAMATFARNQEQMRKSLQDAFGGLFPFGPLEEMGKQNLALFEKTMKMFSPFPAPPTAATGDKGMAAEKPGEPPPSEGSLKELTDKLNALQQQIDALSKAQKD
ncbi:MAG TPA: polyhydroxyalkanoate synthesis repressor PhaR [Stellaceae bacterium]|nr:polyhydroxyalkanoate synthesis repressor PhaR [Stellaceae bacterium]